MTDREKLIQSTELVKKKVAKISKKLETYRVNTKKYKKLNHEKKCLEIFLVIANEELKGVKA